MAVRVRAAVLFMRTRITPLRTRTRTTALVLPSKVENLQNTQENSSLKFTSVIVLFNEIKMKDLRLKVSQTELKGLYNLTEMYIAGFQAVNNDVAYLHSVMLMDYLEYLKKKLIYAKPQNLIKIHLRYMSLFLVCWAKFFKALPPLELSLASQLNDYIYKAVEQDKAAIMAFEEYNNKIIR